MNIKRRVIDNSIEHKVITAMITSDQFIQKIITSIHPEYFTAEHTSKIFEWCKDFYKIYHEAPKQHIQDLYNKNKSQFDDAKQNLFSEFLSTLSDKYEQEESFNVDYLGDQAVIWIKERSIDIAITKARQCLESGRLDKAESALQEYRKAVKATSDWVNPFDEKFVRSTLEGDGEASEDNIFIFPGALGRLSGWHERDWLVAVLAPMKRGKTFWLMEMAVQCVLNKKKVAYFSLEMTEKRMEKRILRRIAAYGKNEGEFVYPAFDCYHNQSGTCELIQRKNKVKLFNNDNSKPTFTKQMKYQVCTACRGTNKFAVATWFTIIKREKMNINKVVRKAKSISRMYGDNFRLISYPASSANTSNIKSDLDMLEYTEGFIPDVVIVDYDALLKPEDARIADVRLRLMETRKMLKNLADSRHILVITAAQGTRKSINKKQMGQDDVGDDISLLAHVDLLYALNQTPQEKSEGLIRVSVLGHRDEDFNEGTNAIILQQRGVGQVLLDSEIIQSKVIESDIFSENLED